MRSESATVNRSSRFCVPVLCFSSGIPVASAEHGRGRNFVTQKGMQYKDCNSIADVVREVFDLIRWDSSRFAANEVTYYFRGENRNHEHDGSNDVPRNPARPSLYYVPGQVNHESDFFNEALRTFPDEFSRDKSTFEILTRMQHYQYPTRLLDITSKLTTAIGFVTNKGYDGKDHSGLNGFIHVYRVKTARIKYGTSDTVTALSNLARLKSDHVTFDEEGLRYLGAECRNERAGFYVEEGSDVTKKLRRDLRKVFCVKPMVNNIRVNFQLGEFFLFGCNEKKSMLDATFDECDYENENAATEGIAEIGLVTLSPMAKQEAPEMSLYLDLGEARPYPDFFHHSPYLSKVYKRRSDNDI